MKKVKTLLLMVCFILSGAWGHAYDVTRTKNTKSEGIPIEIKKDTCVSGSDRSSSFVATIDGHWLSVVFLENLGQVNVAIMAVGGSEAQSESTPTPNGVDFYIPFTGNYIVYFTLPNGDTYYGEFEVTD